MDPQTALNRFNDSHTCRAERVELAGALKRWLVRGGFAPEGILDTDYIDDLERHREPAAFDARWVNHHLNNL